MGFDAAAFGAARKKLSPRTISPPAGFMWDFVNYPVHITQLGTSDDYQIRADPRSWVTGIWALSLAQTFHVDVATGSDTTGTGVGTYFGDFSTCVKTINKAISLGNATAAPYQVIIKTGSYNRNNGVNSAGGTTMPTQNCALIAWGGQVVCHSGDDTLTWANDGSGTNTYSTTRSSVSRVIDPTSFTTHLCADGTTVSSPVELTKVADQATCQATAGSWAQVSTVLYVHRADGSAVTNTNTLGLLSVAVCKLDATSKSVFGKGLTFYGGGTHCLDATYTVTRNLVFEDSHFRFPNTTVATVGNAVAIDGMTGGVAFVRCTAGKAPTDGFNQHVTAGQSYVLTIECKGFDHGNSTGAVSSCNGLTCHETGRMIDFKGEYGYARGGTIRNINTTQAWLVGTYIHDDQGDGTTQAEVQTENNATIWMEGCKVKAGGTNAVRAFSGTAVYRRNCKTLAGTDTAVGTIAAYTI